jgi:hypothetical protein
VAGPDYFQRLNNPSEWTQRMMPNFRNMSRSVCNLRYSEGPGEGGFIATLRFAASKKSEDELCESVLPAVAQQPGVVGVHFCVADDATSGIPTVEKTFRTSTDMCPPYIIMIEGSSARFVRAAAETLAADLSADAAVYQLENTRSNLDGAYGYGYRRRELTGIALGLSPLPK